MKVCIFGNSSFARLIHFAIKNYTDWTVPCFIVDDQYKDGDAFDGIPLIGTERALKTYSPTEVNIFVAMGYKGMGQYRQQVFDHFRKLGFHFPNLIHPSAVVEGEIVGEGNYIGERVLVAPFAKIGDCNLIWAKTNIGHDNNIGSFNSLSGAVLGGFVNVGNNCFLGINAVVKDHTDVADFTFVGPMIYISRNTNPHSVYLPPRSRQECGLDSLQVL